MLSPCRISRCCRLLAPGDTPVRGCPDVIEPVRAVFTAEEVERIADHFQGMAAASGEQRAGGRRSRGHLIPGEPAVGGPPNLVGLSGRRTPADHVQIAVQHRRSVVPARAEVVGNRKGIARGLALVGGLDGYGLRPPVGVHLGEGRRAEGDFTGGWIHGNLVGETGGLLGDAVGGPRGNRGAVVQQGVGERLGLTTVGIDEMLGLSDGNLLECKRRVGGIGLLTASTGRGAGD